MPLIHVVGNTALITLSLVAGMWLAKRRRTALIGVGLSGLIVLLGVLIARRPGWAVAILPLSDLVFYDNLYPVGAVLFVPCIWRFVKPRRRALRVRMAIWCGLACLLCLVPYQDHLTADAVSGGTIFNLEGVCIQSYEYNCSAASMVTLLKLHGVDCTEAEAVDLARTKEGRGTEALGLYRALRAFEPEVKKRAVIRHGSADDLLQTEGPAIILVGLPGGGRSSAAAAYGKRNNWPAGFYHDVLYLGLDPADPNYVRIADPDVGMERWRVEDIRFLYRGQSLMYE